MKWSEAARTRETRSLRRAWEWLRQRLGRGPARHTSELGRRTERAAERYLRERGYRILERNLRLRTGEVDLLAVQGEWLVVVEVRSHKQGGLLPRQTISREKVRRLRRLAQIIWKQPRFQKLSVRIDLVEVETDAQDRPGRVEIIEHLR